MANITVTIASGCPSPNPVHVHTGDVVTWSTSDSRSYVVTPPGGVFSSNAAIRVPSGGSSPGSTVSGTQSTTPKPYTIAPGCSAKVPPDIIIDGGPIPKKTAPTVVKKKGTATKKTAVKKSAPPAKKLAVKKSAAKKAPAKKAPAKKKR